MINFVTYTLRVT